MDKWLHIWQVFVHTWVPIILAVISAPTLITALTKYPRAAGFLSTLRMLLEAISGSTFRDASNAGLKMPLLHRSLPPDGVAPIKMKLPPPPPGVVILGLLAGAGLLFTIGCCYFSGTCRAKVNSDLVNCGEASLFDTWSAIVPEVSKLLKDSSTWEADAIAIVAKAGADAVLCAVEHIVHDVTQPQPGAPQFGGAETIYARGKVLSTRYGGGRRAINFR